MAIALEEYTQAKQVIREFGVDGQTIKMALVASTYTFSAAHTQFSQVSGDEVSGTGYTAGGEALTGVTVDGGGMIDSNNVVWSSATISGIRRAILYISGTLGGVVNPVLFSYLLDDTPADVSVSGSDLTLIINSLGIVKS